MATTTITVSTTQELYNALAKCTGGETILLKGGEYGHFALTMQSKFDYEFPSTVTIASADPSNPAVFSSVDVRDAANITFDGITFDYTFEKGDSISYKPFNFSGCDGLTIKNCTFDGDNASGTGSAASDGYGYAHGLTIRGGSDINIENNESFGFYKGMVFSESQDLIVSGNELYSMRMDGMNFAEVEGVVIEDNYIHDFRGSPASSDHCDMIQFWTSGTDSPTTDVVIRDNVLDVGNGTPSQSIFMRNEVVDTGQASFADMAYRNVLIENNTITNAHKWGISVGETIGLTIRGNTVAHADGGNADGLDASVEIPLINVAPSSTGVVVANNVTWMLTGWTKQPGWVVSNNAFVQDQDPKAPGYYLDVFVGSSLQPSKDGSHHFVALAGGMIDKLNAGSGAIQPQSMGLQALFHVDEANEATRVFDAGASSLNGADLPAGTTYLWDFGDGTTAKGEKVSHSYTDGSDYKVTLTITLPSGVKATESAAVSVESPEILTMNSMGQFTAYEGGDPVILSAAKSASADGLQLGAIGTTASVARQHVVDVVGADDMTIAFTLDADKKGASGELFRLHGSFIVSVTSTGELMVQIMRDGTSPVTLTTKGAGLNSTVDQDHDVVINLDDGKLQVWVDGDLSGQTSMSGVVGGATGFSSHGLAFGNPWNKANFNGDLSAFEISVGADDYPDKPQTTIMTSTLSAEAPDDLAPSLSLASAEAKAMPDSEESQETWSDQVTHLLQREDLRDAFLEEVHDRFVAMLQERLDVYAS